MTIPASRSASSPFQFISTNRLWVRWGFNSSSPSALELDAQSISIQTCFFYFSTVFTSSSGRLILCFTISNLSVGRSDKGDKSSYSSYSSVFCYSSMDELVFWMNESYAKRLTTGTVISSTSSTSNRLADSPPFGYLLMILSAMSSKLETVGVRCYQANELLVGWSYSRSRSSLTSSSTADL